MNFDAKKRIYMYRPFIDGRKSFNGLFAIIKFEMNLDPFTESYFVFSSKKRDRIRIIYWDKTGFSMWIKKLEKEKFPWPTNETSDSITLSNEHLQCVLRGLNFWKYMPHQEIKF